MTGPGLAAVLTAGVLLAACQTTQTDRSTGSRAVAAPAADPNAAADPAPAPRLAVVTPRPPDELRRMPAEEAERRLGRADFRRHDPPAQLWQYRADSCILDLFLYPDPGGDGLVVDHFEARPRGDRPVDPAACYGTLLARAKAG